MLFVCLSIFFSISNGDTQVTSNTENIPSTPSGSTKRDDPGGGRFSSSLDVVSSETPLVTTRNALENPKDSITFSYPMKNYTRFEGETLRLTCEAKGNPPPLRIQWYKNHLPLERQNGRIRIRRPKVGSESSLRSSVRIRNLEIMDKGIYRCDVGNDVNTISSESLVQVHPKKLKGWGRQHNNNHNKHVSIIIFLFF